MGAIAKIAGFGWNEIHTFYNPNTAKWQEFGKRTDPIMKYTSSRVVDNDSCDKLLYNIFPSKICAGVIQSGRDGEGVCSVSQSIFLLNLIELEG